MHIFTDGSFSRKPVVGGFGAVILYNDREIKIGDYSFNCKNNNVAEIAAIAMSIKYIVGNKIIDRMKDKTINIITDSSYAMRKITNNCTYSKDPIEEKYLTYINDFLMATNKKVNFFQIKGHVHDGTKFSYYNNMADQIAHDERMKALEYYNIRSNIIHKKNKER